MIGPQILSSLADAALYSCPQVEVETSQLVQLTYPSGAILFTVITQELQSGPMALLTDDGAEPGFVREYDDEFWLLFGRDGPVFYRRSEVQLLRFISIF